MSQVLKHIITVFSNKSIIVVHDYLETNVPERKFLITHNLENCQAFLQLRLRKFSKNFTFRYVNVVSLISGTYGVYIYYTKRMTK